MILQKIKKFRKSINFIEWEHSYMEMQVKNLEDYLTDVQLLRVSSELLAIMKGDGQSKAQEKLQKAEARIEILNKVHGDKLDKTKSLINKLSQSVQDRRAENEVRLRQCACTCMHACARAGM